MNKSVSKGMATALCALATFALFSCDNKDDEPALVRVTGVSLDQTSAELEPGGTLTLTVSVNPAGAGNKTVAWSSSAEATATVSQTGLVTAIAAGEAVITVKTEDGNFTATCKVTVKEGALPEPPARAVVLEGEISSDLSLRAIDTHTLRGFVYVVDGATLSI